MSWYRAGYYFESKEGRLKIYKSKVKYKGRFRSENWYGRCFVDGKQLTKSSGTENKSKSKKILDEWFEELKFKVKHNLNVQVKTMDECLKEFVKQLDGDNSKTQSTKRTLKERIDIIRKNKDFLKCKTEFLNLDDINKHLSWYKNRLEKQQGKNNVRGQTLLGSLNTISNVVNWSIRKGYRRNKLEGITTKLLSKKLKNQLTSRTQFTMDEYKHLLNVSKKRIKEADSDRLTFERTKLHQFIIIMMNTGLRVDECMGLDWGDIQFCERNNISEKKRDYYDDIESHYLKIRVVNSKTGEREGYGLGGGYFGLQNLLKLYKKNDIKVKGNIWLNQKSFKEGLNNLLNESGLKYEKKGDRKLTRDSKSFRHSFIQIMLDKGISSTLIAKMLGTSTMMIDKNYTANMRIDSLIEQMNKIDRENKLKNTKLKLVKR